MAIEVTEVKGSPKFPRAYRATITGVVVLFVDKTTGIVLKGDACRPIGLYSERWASCLTDPSWEPVNLSISHD